jgi:tRNA threonylcarbamoyladenosine biosynthesis protein TsaB
VRVLGIETATPAGSVALVGPEGLLGEVTAQVPMRHLEWLLPAIDRLLADLGLGRDAVEGVGVSRGPGGFTGLRIGIATAQAWARSAGCPVVGVPTLEALAAAAGAPGHVLPLLDARRGEVAAALFRAEAAPPGPGEAAGLSLVRLLNDTLLPPDDLGTFVPPDAAPLLLLGDALARYREIISRTLPSAVVLPPVTWTPRAAWVAALARERLLRGERDDLYRLHPVYGRRPYVETQPS